MNVWLFHYRSLSRAHYTHIRVGHDQSGMTIIRLVSEKGNFPFLTKHEWKTVRVRKYSKCLETRKEYDLDINNWMSAHGLYTWALNSEGARLCFFSKRSIRVWNIRSSGYLAWRKGGSGEILLVSTNSWKKIIVSWGSASSCGNQS